MGTKNTRKGVTPLRNRLAVTVLAAIALNVLITGYGALAAREEAQADCTRDHGVVQNHECVRAGHDLFHVPL
jgi:hypothetical protein